MQLIILKYKKMNQNIRTIVIYILNNFKRVHSKIYINFFTSTRKNLYAIDLMIKDMRLIKKFK